MDLCNKILLGIFLYAGQAQGWFFRHSKVPTVCFNDLSLGCFPIRTPFVNTNYLPRPPKLVGVKFRFFRSPTIYHTLDLKYSLRRIRSRNVYKPELKTKVIIHGFQDRGDNPWILKMVEELFKKERMNVIVVDWRKGASALDYQQAVADIRLIGAMLARLLTMLEGVGADPATFHVIGHSLGSHIAGNAGRLNKNIGRITGLDPAGPSFESEDAAVRLDKSDAIFVDVVHTDIEPITRMGLGIKQRSGHVDFYPNGGSQQPGCPAHITYMLANLVTGKSGVVSAFACNHMRAIHMFTESINSDCAFNTTMCHSENHITKKACPGCPKSGCSSFGYHADTNRVPGIFYLPTNTESPFCIPSSVA